MMLARSPSSLTPAKFILVLGREGLGRGQEGVEVLVGPGRRFACAPPCAARVGEARMAARSGGRRRRRASGPVLLAAALVEVVAARALLDRGLALLRRRRWPAACRCGTPGVGRLARATCASATSGSGRLKPGPRSLDRVIDRPRPGSPTPMTNSRVPRTAPMILLSSNESIAVSLAF